MPTIDDLLEEAQFRTEAQDAGAGIRTAPGPEPPKNKVVHVPGYGEPLVFPSDATDTEIQQAVADLQIQQPPSGTAAPDVLALAGGVAGAQAGGPFVPVRMAGAYAGGAAGYTAGRGLEFAEAGRFPTYSELGDVLAEAHRTGLFQGGAEGVMPVVGQLATALGGRRLLEKGIAKVGEKLLPGTLTPDVKASEQFLKKVGAPAGMPVDLLYPDPQKAGLITLARNLSANAFTGVTYRRTIENLNQRLQAYAVRVTDQLRQLPTDKAGELLTTQINNNFKELAELPIREVRLEIMKDMPGNIVNATGVIKELRNDKSPLVRSVVNDLKQMVGQNPEMQALLSTLTTKAKGSTTTQALPNLDFNTAWRLKTMLGSYAREVGAAGEFASAPDKVSAAFAHRLEKTLDTQMQASLKHAPGLLQKYKDQLQNYGEQIQTMKNDMVNAVVSKMVGPKGEPGKLADLLLKPNNERTVLAVKRAVQGGGPGTIGRTLGGPQTWQDVEKTLAAAMLKEAERGGAVDGKALEGRIRAIDLDGRGTLSAVSKTFYPNLMTLAKTIERVNTPTKGLGVVIVQMAQATALGAAAGAVAGAMTGDFQSALKTGTAVGTVSVLITPAAVAKLLADERLLQLFKTGLITTQQAKKPSGPLLTAFRQLNAAVAAAVTRGPVSMPTAIPPTRSPAPTTLPNSLPSPPE